MVGVTSLRNDKFFRFNAGKWLLISTGMLVSLFILIVPLTYIFVQAFSQG